MNPDNTLKLLALDGGEKGEEEGTLAGSGEGSTEGPKTITVTIGNTAYEVPDTPEAQRLVRDYQGNLKGMSEAQQKAANLQKIVEEIKASPEEEEGVKSPEISLPERDRRTLEEAKRLGLATREEFAQALKQVKKEAKAEARQEIETERVQNLLSEVLTGCEKDTENYANFNKEEVTRHMWQDLGILHPGRTKEEIKERITLAYNHLGLGQKEEKEKKSPVHQERSGIKTEKGTPPPEPLPKNDDELQKRLSERAREIFTGGGET